MNKDKLKVYIIEILLIITLLFSLIFSNIITRSILSIIMLFFAVFISRFLKKRNISSINKKQVTFLMIVFSLVYVGIFYLFGLYFGFTKAKIILSNYSIVKFIIPITITIISTEIIRSILLQQKVILSIRNKQFNISLILTYIAMVLIDIIIYTGVYNLTNIDDFLTAIGFVFFASLSSNLFYNYISIRYESIGIIIYRLVTILFIYIIPVTPDVYIFFRSFFRILYYYIMYIVFEKLYSRNYYTVSYNEKKKNFIGNIVFFGLMILLIMLISCKFRFGDIVIGSYSMTGTINKGDVIIYEKYTNQEVKKGQVIIFDYNGLQTVHRVIKIENVNNSVRYYTKGDANNSQDKDYITEDKIDGLVRLRIQYIGYPTLWFRSLFK